MSRNLFYTAISTAGELAEFCASLADAKKIGFDTEFISERTYRPELCLVQANVDGRLSVIDSLAISDMRPFWESIVEGGHETIVHAGRQELLFCYESVGRLPRQVVDVQLAAALTGMEYPAGYGNIVKRVLGKGIVSAETRSNWRVRPLSEQQIEYALHDVVHLIELYEKLREDLTRLNRFSWLQSEMESWQRQVMATRSAKSWTKLAGVHRLSNRGMSIARDLCKWRETVAEKRNRPVKQILRDDLIIELSRRETADERSIRSLRGMDHRQIAKLVPEIASTIRRALKGPPESLPPLPARDVLPGLDIMGQFLWVAMSATCRAASVAPSLVGTASDVRELVMYHLDVNGARNGPPPSLASGWRQEVVGQSLEDLIDGRLALRMDDPRSDQPVSFQKTGN